MSKVFKLTSLRFVPDMDATKALTMPTFNIELFVNDELIFAQPNTDAGLTAIATELKNRGVFFDPSMIKYEEDGSVTTLNSGVIFNYGNAENVKVEFLATDFETGLPRNDSLTVFTVPEDGVSGTAIAYQADSSELEEVELVVSPNNDFYAQTRYAALSFSLPKLYYKQVSDQLPEGFDMAFFATIAFNSETDGDIETAWLEVTLGDEHIGIFRNNELGLKELRDAVALKSFLYSPVYSTDAPSDELGDGQLIYLKDDEVILKIRAFSDLNGVATNTGRNNTIAAGTSKSNMIRVYDDTGTGGWVEIPYANNPGPTTRFGGVDFHFNGVGGANGEEPTKGIRKFIISNPTPDINLHTFLTSEGGVIVNLGPVGSMTEPDEGGKVGICLSPRVPSPDATRLYRTDNFDIDGKYAIEVEGKIVPLTFKPEDLPKFFKPGNKYGIVFTSGEATPQGSPVLILKPNMLFGVFGDNHIDFVDYDSVDNIWAEYGVTDNDNSKVIKTIEDDNYDFWDNTFGRKARQWFDGWFKLTRPVTRRLKMVTAATGAPVDYYGSGFITDKNGNEYPFVDGAFEITLPEGLTGTRDFIVGSGLASSMFGDWSDYTEDGIQIYWQDVTDTLQPGMTAQINAGPWFRSEWLSEFLVSTPFDFIVNDRNEAFNISMSYNFDLAEKNVMAFENPSAVIEGKVVTVSLAPFPHEKPNEATNVLFIHRGVGYDELPSDSPYKAQDEVYDIYVNGRVFKDQVINVGESTTTALHEFFSTQLDENTPEVLQALMSGYLRHNVLYTEGTESLRLMTSQFNKLDTDRPELNLYIKGKNEKSIFFLKNSNAYSETFEGINVYFSVTIK